MPALELSQGIEKVHLVNDDFAMGLWSWDKMQKYPNVSYLTKTFWVTTDPLSHHPIETKPEKRLQRHDPTHVIDLLGWEKSSPPASATLRLRVFSCQQVIPGTDSPGRMALLEIHSLNFMEVLERGFVFGSRIYEAKAQDYLVDGQQDGSLEFTEVLGRACLAGKDTNPNIFGQIRFTHRVSTLVTHLTQLGSD